MKRVWSDTEIEFLKSHADKLSISELAKRLKRSYSSVKKKLYYLELSHYSLRRRWSSTEDAALKEANAKISYFELARRLNRSPARIAGRVHELGLPKRHQRFSETEKEKVISLLERYYSVPEIALQLGRSPSSVHAFMKRENLKVIHKELSFSISEAAYLAGLVDGEGTVTVCVSYSPKNGRPYITPEAIISGTDEKLLSWLESCLGTPTIQFDKRRDAAFKVRVYSPLLKSFLKEIRPYLIIKAEQTDLILELLLVKEHPQKNLHRQVEIAAEIRRLNLKRYPKRSIQLQRIEKTIQRLEGFLARQNNAPLES